MATGESCEDRIRPRPGVRRGGPARYALPHREKLAAKGAVHSSSVARAPVFGPRDTSWSGFATILHYVTTAAMKICEPTVAEGALHEHRASHRSCWHSSPLHRSAILI